MTNTPGSTSYPYGKKGQITINHNSNNEYIGFEYKADATCLK